ncbi:hypothetical protein EJ06DRAFT_191895 [Trichodelitschia bisporula]|uniref:Uncharacterized protein n=1 Tax=Trichodelitschia bisporula TaxID=703511 RepID=A0A6G1I7P1_9PEZI|nr:hypothetical protein EJ06DRAFT_191895 [Trichodelitschia bisporula]
MPKLGHNITSARVLALEAGKGMRRMTVPEGGLRPKKKGDIETHDVLIQPRRGAKRPPSPPEWRSKTPLTEAKGALNSPSTSTSQTTAIPNRGTIFRAAPRRSLPPSRCPVPSSSRSPTLLGFLPKASTAWTSTFCLLHDSSAPCRSFQAERPISPDPMTASIPLPRRRIALAFLPTHPHSMGILRNRSEEAATDADADAGTRPTTRPGQRSKFLVAGCRRNLTFSSPQEEPS